MDTKDWIAISIAAITLINGWCQFWVKERLFSKDTVVTDPVLKFFKSKGGILLIAITGVVSIASIWLLVLQVTSSEPLTRISCVVISGLTVAAVLNLVLIQAIFTLRRLASLMERIEEAKDEALIYAITMGG